MTDLDALASWLDRYREAWRSNEAKTIRALFTDDARYRWHPWEQPAVGADAIVEAWLEQPDDPDTWTFEAEPLAVNGDLGVARCVSRYRASGGKPARTYHNVFILHLTADGRCSDFTEYYMKEGQA